MGNILIVDVEADGPCPGIYSMVSIGIVMYGEGKTPEFFGKFAPITEGFKPDALAISGITRMEHQAYPDPGRETLRMVNWIADNCTRKPVFVSDNPGFDFAFFNYYCHRFVGGNPCGWSSRRIGDFYAGLVGDFFAQSKWKSLRRTRHTHNPVDDARGNCEALHSLLTGKYRHGKTT